ncbi:MAG: arginase family protein, partial [Terriglobales bacterium]
MTEKIQALFSGTLSELLCNQSRIPRAEVAGCAERSYIKVRELELSNPAKTRVLGTEKLNMPLRTTTFSSINPRQIRVIGVPLDLGQSRRGVDMGPSAVRVAGLEARLEAIGHVVEDAGNIAVAIPEQKKEGAASAKYLKEITATCVKSADLVLKTLEAGKVPLVLGGDHSVAAGTVSGVAEFYRRQGQKIGLLWIDAHTDMNTPESSPSGNVHGMPLASIMGLPPFELGK